MMDVQYKFDNFVFINGRLMTEEQQEISLPPKECAVLLFMLERANSVISKEMLITHVWKGGAVSDESLTRCIYILRRALSNSNIKNFIKTIYGKGYCFNANVEAIESPDTSLQKISTEISETESKTCNIAIFPFDMKKRCMAKFFHEQLVDWLCCFKAVNNPSLNVVSSCFTRSAQDSDSFLLVIEKSQADYYISGGEIDYGDNSIVCIELVKASGHSVFHRKGVQLTDDQHVNYRALCRATFDLLSLIGSTESAQID